MRRLRTLHRGATIAAAVVLSVVVVAAGLAAGFGASAGHRRSAAGHPPSSSTSGHHHRHPAESTTTTQTPDRRYRPSYLPEKAGATSPIGSHVLALLETMDPPPAAFTPSLPAVPVADTKDGLDFSVAFTRELLDIDFARESRHDLAQWAQGEAAATLFQGVPLRAARNTLYASLFEPKRVGGSATGDPVPSAAGWAAAARSRLVWHVSKLWPSENRSWQNAVASGGDGARDPLLTVYNLTGTLTVARHGHRMSASHFTLTLGIGSALHHSGYGAASVSSWKVR